MLDLENSNSDLLFNPDSTTMRLKNLGLTEDCRKVINKYDRFFANKKRETEFKNFDIEDKNNDNIDLIITSIMLGIKSINLDDILKEIIRFYFAEEKNYEELFKYADEEFILSLFNDTFGTSIKSYEELNDVYKSLVFTYFTTSLNDGKKVSRYSKYLLKKKSTNVYLFINSLMRDKTTIEYYERISNELVKEFGIDELLSFMEIEDYIDSDAFIDVYKCILKYISEQLFNGIDEYDLYKSYIDTRENKYWYDKLNNEYNLLKSAIGFLKKIKQTENQIKIVDIDKFAKD